MRSSGCRFALGPYRHRAGPRACAGLRSFNAATSSPLISSVIERKARCPTPSIDRQRFSRRFGADLAATLRASTSPLRVSALSDEAGIARPIRK